MALGQASASTQMVGLFIRLPEVGTAALKNEGLVIGRHIDRFKELKAVFLGQRENGLKITDSLMGCLAFKPGIKLSITRAGESPFVIEGTIDDSYGIFAQNVVHALKKGLNLWPGHDMKGVRREQAVKGLGRPKRLYIKGYRGGGVLKVCFIEPETNPRKIICSL